jgi:hypothetical protein
MTREKFLLCVEKNVNGCWEWTKGKDIKGYGRCSMFFGGRREQMAHRVSYLLFKGDIPEGLSLDHLCRNRKCVNPDHLEPVTNHENILRGEGGAGINARKTHCIHGHEFTPENTIIRSVGGRSCRICAYRRKDAWESKNTDYHHKYYLNRKLAK